MSVRAQTLDDQDTGAPNRVPGRWLQRLSFVVILMGVGALVAGVITSRMEIRYQATAVVSVPAGADAVSFLDDAEQASFVGADGAELGVTADGDMLSFVGTSSRPSQSVAVATTGAQAFVASANDPTIRITEPAETPDTPSSPKRLRASLIGVGLGALVGLVLQTALRPPRSDDTVAYIPSWTSADPDPEPVASTSSVTSARVGRKSTAEALNLAAELTTPSERPLPAASREQSPGFDAPDVVFAGETGPDAASSVTIPGLDDDSHDAGARGVVLLDLNPMDEATIDRDLAALDSRARKTATSGDTPTSSASPKRPSGIFGSLLADDESDESDQIGETETSSLWNDGDFDRTQAVDMVTDERVDDDATVDGDDPGDPDDEPLTFDAPFDPGQATAEANQADDEEIEEAEEFVEVTIVRPVDGEPEFEVDYNADDSGLVAQISFLTNEVQRYQERIETERSDHLAARSDLEAAHGQSIIELEAQLADTQAELVAASYNDDDRTEELELRIGVLESELKVSEASLERLERERQSVLDRHQVHDDDLAAENEFLRSEVARYQTSLDGERVDHATAVAATRLENQDELDRIHREHRVTLNQLAQTNRNLLTAQRNEAERMMAALEAQHQTALDEAHSDYEERLRLAREHLSEQLATSHDRAVADIAEEHETELAAMHERLDAALLNQRRTQERLDALLKDQHELERRADQLKRGLDHGTRTQLEERRRLENRSRQLEALLSTSEERLAQERRRTSDVVRNLLQESASSAADADWARQHLVEGQRTNETDHEQEIASLVAEAQAYERATAQREYELEATIASLRARIDGETSASESS